MFRQRQDDDKAVCPFNNTHTFAKEKLIFHLNRCKDKAKVIHKFAVCRYNGLHFIPKEKLEEHELFCDDREEVRKMVESMKRSFDRINRERERSREKRKSEDIKEKEDEGEDDHGDDEDHTLSECDECLEALRDLVLDDHPKLKKYMAKY
jgi:hypothetical protein